MNADLLADSILGEVLEDTAKHLQDLEDEETVEDHALAMMDTPTLGEVIRRMEEMEVGRGFMGQGRVSAD